MSYCGECGAEMRPLATTVYCPNDCDRKVPRRDDIAKNYNCYRCGSADTAPFLNCDEADMHCIPCGAIWFA